MRLAAPPGIEPELIARWDPLVIRLARRYGAWRGPVRDSEEYADGQMGLLAACRGFDPAKGVSFKTYAYGCVKNSILDGHRTRKFGPVYGPGPRLIPFTQFDMVDPEGERDFGAELADPEPSPWALLADRELADLLLAGLCPRWRRLVWRWAVEGWTMEEAGAAEDPPISRGRVHQILQKAVPKLRARAEGHAIA